MPLIKTIMVKKSATLLKEWRRLYFIKIDYTIHRLASIMTLRIIRFRTDEVNNMKSSFTYVVR